jgi:hypothetical protein
MRWTRWISRLSLAICVLAGPAYVVWVAGIEGPKALVVAGLVVLVAACGALAHYWMGRARG